LPPGVSKEHIEAEMGQVPMGFSDETDLDSVRVFVNRSGRTLDRERLLVTLRYAIAEWENYVRAICGDRSTETVMEGAREDWERAATLVRDNSKTIQDELPEKQKRNPTEELLATWAQHGVDQVEKMDAFVVRRRAARESSKEEQAKLDNKEGKETRQAFEALNNTLRRVPSR
jgi:hypothetical protein